MRLVLQHAAAVVLVAAATMAGGVAAAAAPYDLAGKRELLVDDFLIDSLEGASLELQRPNEEEVVLIHDQPWEGNTCCYHTVFRDGDTYRMYYRGGHFDEATNKQTHPEVFCYAESVDGIHWVKPELGIHDFRGSAANNIVIGNAVHAHCFAPFKDGNPAAKAGEKYKAVTREPGGLVSYKSADAIHWEQMSREPIITDGAFDSLNVAFWDDYRRRYVDFHRAFRNGVRDVKTSTSDDFQSWSKAEWLEYTGAPTQHLYTNGIVAYERAPQFFVGLPKRFNPDRNPSGHPGKGVSDCVLMTSRDGVSFRRWDEAFVRPGRQPDRWVNRNNLPAFGMVITKADVENAPDELSFYLTEGYYRGDAVRLRRYTLRLDGFVSVSAPPSGGEMTTKPVLLGGTGASPELRLNFATSAMGSLRCEVLDESGEAVAGFGLQDCNEMCGDAYDARVTWGTGRGLSELAGRPVKLRFVMQDADLYAIHVPAVGAKLADWQAER